VVSRNSSYAGQALCFILVFYTVRRPCLPSSFQANPPVMPVGVLYVLINAFIRVRNNRMDLDNEPPVAYVTTADGASLNSTGSPTRRFVLTLPLAEHSEEVC